MGCFDDNDIALLTSGSPSAAERGALNHHLDTCADCRELVAESLRVEGHGAAQPLRAGDKVGRYLVLEPEAAGAMGMVYAAYDPELGRKVALKLLHADPARDAQHADGRARLLREAQALARLSHPHVVTIHDVGTVDDQVFLAMEFVEAGTLRDWLLAQPRGWREVVAVMIQAGEGLAAAHEAHLVHRDLKPDNIVIDGRGRPRLTDFGLARSPIEPGDPAVELASVAALPGTLHTATGALIGTPAYMAPELLRGQGATELSDQFSFCGTLFEALFGARPFVGTTVAQLLAASQRPLSPPPTPPVPVWLWRVLQRGLAPEPAARFPSMPALLQQLRRGLDHRPWRLRAALGAVAVVAVGTAAWIARPAHELCTGGNAAWSSAWDDAAAQQVKDAFAASGRPSADGSAREVSRLLDGLRARWQASYLQICEATRVHGEQSEALLDVRLSCLADRRNEIASLTRVLSGGEPKVVDRAVAAVLSLPRLEACASVRGAKDPLAPQVAPEALARLSSDLAQIRVLQYVSKVDEAQQLATSALERARAPGFLPQLARLLFLQGTLASSAGDNPRAERLLHEAAAAAEESHEDLTAADAWTSLVSVVGTYLSRPEEGRRWARYAEAAIRRGGGDDEREALRLRQLGMVVWRLDGQLDEALELSLRARDLTERAHGERVEFQTVLCEENIAGIYFDMARLEEALALHRKTAATTERLFGAGHPRMATAEVNIGEDLVMLDRADEGLPWLRKALALVSAGTPAPGADGYCLHRLGAAHRQQGQFAIALEEDRRAVAAAGLAGQRGAYWESASLTGVGLDLLGLGRAKEAIAPLEVAVRERLHQGPPGDLAESRAALGRARWEGGEHAAGRALVVEALEVVRPLAKRYGSLFERRERALDAWLQTHP